MQPAEPYRLAVRRWLLRACLALPVLMLLANLLAWWRWGFDLPFFDDWRVFDDRNALSLAPARLFASINNTISPVGLTLDVFAQRWLGGNALAYQSLSMLVVLGGLLWLQWRLLGWALRDGLQQALAFAFSFLMLQSGTYWGEQSLAYHQALPVLALLAATWLAVAARWRGLLSVLVVFLLGILSGLSYISGAVAALVLGASWIVIALLPGSQSVGALTKRLRRSGYALFLSGGFTALLQIVMTRVVKPGKWDQHLDITWPWHLDYWIYLAGKLGRSTGHGFESIRLELGWVALVLLAFVVAAGLLARPLIDSLATGHTMRHRVAVVFVPWCVVVLAYLLLIGMGRTGLHFEPVHGRQEVFRFGYERFHFFWITPLFPWLAAALALLLRRLVRPRCTLAAGLVAVLVLAGARGVFDVPAFYRTASDFRLSELRCLEQQLGSGEPMACDWHRVIGLPDLTRGYIYARDIGASFVRHMPLVARAGFGHELLRWRHTSDFAAGRWHNVEHGVDGWLEGGVDPQLEVSLAGAGQLDRCRTLGVQMRLDAHAPDTLQIFYRPVGQPAYAEQFSVRQTYEPDAQGRVRLEFSIDSAAGFEPVLRLDPADGHAHFRPLDLHITCRLLDPP